MKIAIVSEFFHPKVGGQEVRYLELGRALVRQGHGVSVYTTRFDSSLLAREVMGGIEVHRITDAFRFHRRPGQSLFGISRNPVDILRFTWNLIARRRELGSYDVRIFNIWPVLPAIVLPRLVHSMSVVDWCEIRRTLFWHVVYRWVANPRAFHIAVSDAIRETLSVRYHLRRDRTQSIVSGIHYKDYRSNGSEKRDKTILFLGRLSEHKNPVTALEAFASAGLGGKGYTLHFAGDGPLLSRLREMAGSTTGVAVHGAVDAAAKIALLKSAALLVLPSRREGFPRVIAEAAASGAPTLTTVYPENGSVSVVNQYKIGWVCAPAAAELGASMEKYSRMDDAWRAVSATCRRVAQAEFDWHAVTAQLTRFLEDHS